MTSIRVRYLVGAPLFADVLARRVADEPDLELDSIESLDDDALAGADVLLIDRAARGLSSTLTCLDGLATHPSVVVVAAHDDPEDAIAAARSGAAAWLDPACTADELLLVLRRVNAGLAFYPRHRQAAVLDALRADAERDPDPGPLDRLTPREHEVLVVMADGLDNRCIGDVLGMSYNTVRTHINEIFRKLDVHNRVEAVRMLGTHSDHAARARHSADGILDRGRRTNRSGPGAYPPVGGQRGTRMENVTPPDGG